MYKEEFLHLPKVYVNRSKFNFRPKNYTTINVGDLVPIYRPIYVVPGDTWKGSCGQLMELTPMLSLVFDVLICDIFCFYVPLRLLWEDFIYFYGENKKDPYDSIGTYSIPQVKIPEGGYEVGTIANYFGIRPGVGSTNDNEITISALPFRAYALIVNEYFVSDFLDSKANVNYDISATVIGSNGSNYVSDLVLGGKPFIANKLHDKFTSCLPKPQAGESVPLPLGDNAPIYFGKSPNSTYPDFPDSLIDKDLTFRGNGTNNPDILATENGASTGLSLSNGQMANVYADMSAATATSINDLRQALVIQHMLESESRMGNRYYSLLLGDFGVISDDLTINRPEYLGGARFTINNNPVVQTSQTANTPQGTTTSYSITSHYSDNFHKSFKEPGYIIMLSTIRYPHSYPQGLNKLWSDKDKLDFYNPHFDGLGEVPIFNKEIFMSGNNQVDNEVFGYMPYGTDLRTMENMATGEMSPDYRQPLLTYHYADDYDQTPALSSSWLKEDKNNVERTLDKDSSLVSNFRCQFQFNFVATRPITSPGLPGLKYF